MAFAKLGLLVGHPGELKDRTLNKVASWMDVVSPHPNSKVAPMVSSVEEGLQRLFSDGKIAVEQPMLRDIEAHIKAASRDLRGANAPFGIFHNGTRTLGRLCYLACRRLKPSVVVETGVAYGVTSAYILQALKENEHGVLHSIDLPPLAAAGRNYVGYLVPEHLRRGWRLEVGSARAKLPPLLKRIASIDIFVHDSLHTYSQMKWELETALSAMLPGGIAIADDIEGNRAFDDILERADVESGFAIQQEGKPALCGALRTKCIPS